jgi:hypothetical protein
MKHYLESRGEKISYIQNKRMKTNCIGHILPRNCHLRHVFAGKMKGEGRWRRCKQLLYERTGGKRYWKLEALDHTLWETGFGKGYDPLLRQTAC